MDEKVGCGRAERRHVRIFPGDVVTCLCADRDFANVWGSSGCEITTDADGNARLVFTGESNWGCRLSYMEPVKLDGLEITLSDVEIDEGAAPTLVLGNEQGQWVDSDIPTFIHYNTKTSGTIGAVEHGYLLGKDYMADDQPRMINETAFAGALSPEMKISFNQKDENTWTYTVNGQDFDFDASHLSSLADLDNVYLNFGNWTQGTYETSFVVANIKEDRPTTTTTEAPTTTTEAPTTTTQGENSSSPASDDETVPTTEGSVSEDDASVDGDEGGSNVALYIVLAVVILACIGAGVFIVLKYVVKKPNDTPPNGTTSDSTTDTKPEE